MIQCSPQTTIQWRLDVGKKFLLTPKSDLIMISSCERLLLDHLIRAIIGDRFAHHTNKIISPQRGEKASLLSTQEETIYEYKF